LFDRDYNPSVRRRFFVEQFEGATATLRGEAAEHLGRVLRAEPGQLYELSDGVCVWLGRVESIGMLKRGENRIEFSLVEPIAVHEPKLQIDLLIAIVKFDRFEWCLEKATELGVRNILPIAAARSEKALVAATEKRHARWEKILLESAQQSRRVRAPGLADAVTTEKAFAQNQAECRILLSERADAEALRNVLRGSTSNSVALAIGPEGGWTDGELDVARAAKFVEASLGQLILRTETAVLAALSVLNFALGE
jgi:16S rRNA (uracil1498-N3)-methyltransferase